MNTQLAGLVFIIVVLCEGIKRAGLKSKYIPLLAALLGMGGGVYLGGANWISSTSGILVGLATTGGYTMFKKIQE